MLLFKKKKTAYLVICPSNQPLCFSPLSQVGGRALLPSLQPNRAPATAPLVSASPPCKMRNTTRLKQTAVAWKFGTQVQVSLPSQRFCAVSERESKTVRRLAVVPFLARPKPKIPFLGLSFLQNQTETLATQASDTWLRVYATSAPALYIVFLLLV